MWVGNVHTYFGEMICSQVIVVMKLLVADLMVLKCPPSILLATLIHAR